MRLRGAFRIFWIGGLVAFAIVILLGLPLSIAEVPGGILDHQAAGSAKRVNEIHAAWEAGGLIGTARIAMFADLIFIGIYGLGSVLGGWYYYRTGTGIVRTIGLIIIICAMIFLITDYGETSAQLVQVQRDTGSDKLAGFAATMRPIKVAVWIGTFVGIIAAFAIRWITGPKT